MKVAPTKVFIPQNSAQSFKTYIFLGSLWSVSGKEKAITGINQIERTVMWSDGRLDSFETILNGSNYHPLKV